MARLIRISDGEGFSGSRSETYEVFKNRMLGEIISNRPIVGCCIKVGSLTAGTYSKRDWWMTSIITEILEDKGDYVKFKTENSTYEWWA